jgi:hypothetical protein
MTNRVYRIQLITLLLLFAGLADVRAQNAASTPVLPPLIPWSGASENLVAHPDDPWITPAEVSNLEATPSYDETMDWLRRLEQASPQIHLSLIGSSLEQRDIYMVVASAEGARTPTELRENGRPTLLAHAGIHSGEIDGKDAGMMLLRDLTVSGASDLLQQVNFLFIPILSVDGHERSSRFSRINQRGPVEQGWRTNSRNLNLNRDFAKLDTEEVAALVLVMNDWDPDLYLDLHVTDGADYQADITYGYNGSHAWSPAIAQWLDTVFRPTVDSALIEAGHVPAPLLFSANRMDMTGGNFEWTAAPRFSTGYSDARHLPHVLLENHSLKPYRRRVLGTYVFLEAAMRALASEFESLRTGVELDRSRLWDPMPLGWTDSDPPPDTMLHQGIRSERFVSPISGGEVVRWLGEPEDFDIPIITTTKPSVLADRPTAYYIPAAWSNIAYKLMTHGIELERVLEPTNVRATMYRLPEATLAGGAFEGHVRVDPGTLQREERDLELAPGSHVVPADQPLGDLAMLLLEPQSGDSFFQWGFFLEILQRTEYAEEYVMEPTATRMLEEDPVLKEEFDQLLQSDSTFANSPDARLDWFYEKTPFFDEQYRLYPIGRAMD